MNVVSLVGRPNTGKSALFNRIAKKRVAIVFDQPGVTRDRVTREVEVQGRKVMLVDTGGIAFDRRVTNDPLDAETQGQAFSFLGFAGKPAGYMIVFCCCAVAYLVAWCIMKTLVPRYSPIKA
jgi:predicted GTPase